MADDGAEVTPAPGSGQAPVADTGPGFWEDFWHRWAERRAGRTSGLQIERQVMRGALLLLVVGFGVSAVFVLESRNLRIFAVAVGTFVAAGFMGAFAGFLFGLPRDAPAVPDDRTRLRFLVNSNLLKVSDFVTTVIVGLSLTQVGQAVPALTRYGDAIREPLGGSTQAATTGIVLILVGFSGAAMLSYLWTTVRMRERLERAEMELSLVQRTDGAIQVVVGFVKDDEGDIDAVALSLAPLSRAQLGELRARLPSLVVSGDTQRSERMRVVRRVIDELLARRGGSGP